MDPSGNQRTNISDEGAPSGRWGHAAVWTGNEMIVWGGRNRFESDGHSADGARYDSKANVWKPMSSENAPTARSQMASVWTGEELIVWGGFGNGATAWNTGERYNPRTDQWRPLSTIVAPHARVEPQFVWTGRELLIWGGITPDLKRTLRSGARYDPSTDSWSEMPSDREAPEVWGAQAIWTGREMIVWGGAHHHPEGEANVVTSRGAAYNPVRNRWRPLSTKGAPAARFFHTSVWTGSRLVVWGGGNQDPSTSFDDGGEYDPKQDSWHPLSWTKRPSARGMHSAVWADHKMVIFGGSTGGSSAFSDVGIWQESTLLHEDARIVATGEWSTIENGLRGRLILAQGRELGQARIRESLVYVELENVGTERFTEINVYFDPDALSCNLTNAKGNPVPQTNGAGSGGRPGKTWVTIPFDSALRLRANPYGFGRDNGLLIPLNTASWMIRDQESYSLSGKLTINPPESKANTWKGELLLPKAQIELQK